MTVKDLNKVAGLIKDIRAWEAFLHVLDMEEAKLVGKLISDLTAEELIRLNAEYKLIQRLRKTRDTWLSMEKNNYGS